MDQPQFDLRRFVFDANRPTPEPASAGGEFKVEWRATLEPALALLPKLPSVQRTDFTFLNAPTKDGFHLFGRSIDESGKLAVWALERRIFELLPDPFFWMREYGIRADGRGIEEVPHLPAAIPARTVDDVRALFRDGDGAFLIGGAQALVDGAGIRLCRGKPDAKIVEQLWAFLPDSARRQVSFASYSDDGIPDAAQLIVVPESANAARPGYLTADQCRDYPESSFEQQLQYSLDHRDQALFDKLMARRSSRETLRLAVWLVVASLVVLIVAKIAMIAR